MNIATYAIGVGLTMVFMFAVVLGMHLTDRREQREQEEIRRSRLGLR